MRRIAVRVLAAVVVLVLLVAGLGYVYLRQSLPTISGRVTIGGISAPVDIVRDADAIPHIIATSKADAFFGLGYVHAQDRLWQMEFQRRIGHGRLSEVFGEATIPQDRFLRTVGFGRAAVSAWQHLPADVRAQIDAYVAGVNAFIDTHHGRLLPPEFTLLRFEPEHFTGPDVVVWVKMMAWDLSANYTLELVRRGLAGKVGAERLAQLMPPYPQNGLSIVHPPVALDESAKKIGPAKAGPYASLLNENSPIRQYVGSDFSRTSTQSADIRIGPAEAGPYDSLRQSLSGGLPFVTDLLLDGGKTEAIGSNNWVVDGTLTASGKPLLANDPHLGTHVPSLWYLAHVSAGDFDIIGATIPGAPAVAIGRNRFIAWGETNVAADVQDLFQERIDASGRTVEFQGTQEPITIIPETIQVKGGAPIQLSVRITRHGPLVSDAINANNAASKTVPRPADVEPLAFKWTALDEQDTTIVAFLKLNEARNWNDFTAALSAFVVPSQNFVYADAEGHIGYYAPGHIPIRASGDGSQPTPGWTGTSEWVGRIPFEELPHAFDPPEHFIVTANNRPMPADYKYNLGLDFPEPYRAQRITDLLRTSKKFTSDTFRDIQSDTFSLNAKSLLPRLLPHVSSKTPNVEQAVVLLKSWDFESSGDSAAAAIFQAWFHELPPALVGDELGPTAMADYAPRFSYITRFVSRILDAGDSPWCDDVDTPERETCDQTISAALTAAVNDLTKRLGSDLSRWRWDGVHIAVFPHQGLDSVGLLRPLLSRRVPNGGDWSTVNVGPVAADAPYEQLSVPGYREIIDLSSANDSRFLVDVGESGHFLSRHYDDFLRDWQATRLKKMRTAPEDFENGALGRLTLVPK